MPASPTMDAPFVSATTPLSAAELFGRVATAKCRSVSETQPRLIPALFSKEAAIRANSAWSFHVKHLRTVNKFSFNYFKCLLTRPNLNIRYTQL